MLTASKPEAQKRLICTPETRKSQPALSKAVLGKTEPCSPTGDTQPITTSSTSAGSKSWRACSWLSNPPSKSTGLTSCKLPSFLPLPRGVRTASKTIAWLMNHLLVMLEDDNLVKILFMSRIESPRSQPPPQVQAKPQAKPRPDIPKELRQIEPQVKQQARSSASKGSRVDIKA